MYVSCCGNNPSWHSKGGITDSRATPPIPAAPAVFSPNTGLVYRVAGAVGAVGCNPTPLHLAAPAAPSTLYTSPVFGENTAGAVGIGGVALL
jgi:hypothetical protein